MSKKERKRLSDLFLRKENYIDSKLKGLEGDVKTMQRRLLELIMSDYVGKFKVDEAGKIIVNEYNMRLAREVEDLMDRFSAKFQKSVLKEFATDMLKLTDFSADYYKGMGFAEAKIKSIEEGLGFISERIGITDKGNIIKNSYLDSLSENAEVRKELKDFVINSVAGQKNYAEYLKGMKELIVGNELVEGTLQKYYSQFAYDTYNQVDSAINKNFADNLGLKHFIYMGSLIDTSRAFCIKRAGKAFSVKETEDWKNDPDLIDKKTKDTYNPLIERGRYRCRHSIRYISQELACEMRPDLCEDAEMEFNPNMTLNEELNWGEKIMKNSEEFEEKYGLGSCGPVADNLVDMMQRQGLDARILSADYTTNPNNPEKMFGHYVAVLMDEDKPVKIYDPTNPFTIRSIIELKDNKIPYNFMNYEIWDKTGRSPDDEIFTKEMVEWWKKRL